MENIFQKLATWLVPPGRKSLTLSLPMRQGPALLMFGQSNPLMTNNFYLNMVSNFETGIIDTTRDVVTCIYKDCIVLS